MSPLNSEIPDVDFALDDPLDPDTKKKTSDPADCAAYELPNPPAIAIEAVVLSRGVGLSSFQFPEPPPPPPPTEYDDPAALYIVPETTRSPPKTAVPLVGDAEVFEPTMPLTKKFVSAELTGFAADDPARDSLKTVRLL